MNNRIKPFTINGQPLPIREFTPVDEWDPVDPQDQIFKPCKGALWLPITQLFRINDPTKENLNLFILSTKRCYNGDIMRIHMSRYLNYFEKYYDPDHELVWMMAKIKCNIDTIPGYSK